MIIKISKVKITEIQPQKDGLVALASMVINDSYAVRSIGIYKALSGGYRGYRLTFPTKKINYSSLEIFSPINHVARRIADRAVINEFLEVKRRSVL